MGPALEPIAPETQLPAKIRVAFKAFAKKSVANPRSKASHGKCDNAAEATAHSRLLVANRWLPRRRKWFLTIARLLTRRVKTKNVNKKQTITLWNWVERFISRSPPPCFGLYQLYLLFDVITANMQDQEVVTQVADGHTCVKTELPLKL